MSNDQTPPPPPQQGHPRPQRPLPPPQPPVIRVVAKPGGLAQFFTMIFGLLLLGGIFIFGLVLGVFFSFAAQTAEDAVYPTVYRQGTSADRIAIIPVEGVIDDFTSWSVREAVSYVISNQRSENIRAVVLRVDSPGGGVTASDQIWHEVEQLKNAGIPVVASFGGMAASGGYYVACGTDHIVAEETTTTGSIGVIAQIFTMQELMNKVGVEPITLVASGSPEKDVANDIFHAWTDEDREKVRTMLDAAYDTFRDRVKAGRLNTIGGESALDEVADGSIFTSAAAKDLGLVDSIGYLDDAIAQAEKMGGAIVGRSEVIRIEPPLALFGGLWAQERPAGRRFSDDALNADHLRSLVNDLAAPRVMYLVR